MPTLTAYVANLLITGDEVTSTSDGNSWIRNLIRFNCGQREFVFIQADDIARGQIHNRQKILSETSIVTVENVAEEEKELVLETLNAICWLLSFATQSSVICYGHEFSNQKQFFSVTGIANPFRPPFRLADTALVKHFVEQSYSTYFNLKDSRNLPVVFDYLLQSQHPNQKIEVKLILLFVLLENMKCSWAHANNILYEKGYFRDSSQPKKNKRKNKGKLPRFHFEDLLKKMFMDINMPIPNMTAIIELRNNLIHSGLSQLECPSQQEMYENVQDIIREYLLRLLGFSGEYFLYKGSGETPNMLP